MEVWSFLLAPFTFIFIVIYITIACYCPELLGEGRKHWHANNPISFHLIVESLGSDILLGDEQQAKVGKLYFWVLQY